MHKKFGLFFCCSVPDEIITAGVLIAAVECVLALQVTNVANAQTEVDDRDFILVSIASAVVAQ